MADNVPTSGWMERASKEVGESFTFAFRDPNWPRKFIIGSIMVLASGFLIGTVFLAGYVARLARRVHEGESEPLPEWDDWGAMASDGIRCLVIYFGHLIPVILLGVLMILALGGAVSLAVDPADMPSGIGLLIVASVIVGSIVYTLVILAASLVAVASLVRFLRADDLHAGFELRESIADVRRDPLTYLIVFWAISVSNFVAQFGLLFLCVGILPAFFWSIAVGGHALGRAMRTVDSVDHSPLGT